MLTRSFGKKVVRAVRTGPNKRSSPVTHGFQTLIMSQLMVRYEYVAAMTSTCQVGPGKSKKGKTRTTTLDNRDGTKKR